MRRKATFQVLLVVVLALTAFQIAPLRPAEAQDAHVEEVLAHINQVRAEHGVGPVALDAVLTASAQRQLNDMTAHDFLGHIGSDGSKPGQRATDAGYIWRAVGENCLYRWDFSAAGAVAQWVSSGPHLANMVNPAYVHAGIAYGQSASGKVYYVLVLAAPM